MAIKSRAAAASLCIVILLVSGCSKGGGGGPATPYRSSTGPSLDAIPEITAAASVKIAGVSLNAGARVSVQGGQEAVSTTSNGDGAFTFEIPLRPNARNRLLVTEQLEDGSDSPPATAFVTQDGQPPELHIDAPSAGATTTAANVTIVGRVLDPLAGTVGLQVFVGEADGERRAQVSTGVGATATFSLADYPLAAMGATTIPIRAMDRVGNETRTSVEVIREPTTYPALTVVSGNGQTARVHELLEEPLRVLVERAAGEPLAGKAVRFEITRSDGKVSVDGNGGGLVFTALTNSAGIAEARWLLGSDAGNANNRLLVTSRGVTGTGQLFASATAGAPVQLNVGSGNEQIASAGADAPEFLRAWVSDGCNGVPDVDVTFRVARGDGTLRTPVRFGAKELTVPTGPTGHAAVILTTGSSPGNNVVTASFAGQAGEPVEFVVFGLRADQPTTTFEGQVLDNSGLAIGGVSCRLEMPGQDPYEAVTDAEGVFLFTDLVGSGESHLIIDGGTATTLADVNAVEPIPIDPAELRFPGLAYEPVITARARNRLLRPILLPRLDPSNDVLYDGTSDVELEVEGMEGLRMFVAAGSVTLADGTRPSPAAPVHLALNQVHADDIPMQPEDGASPPFAWTLQPSNTRFDPPVRIEYPNMSGLAPRAAAFFLSFNHDTGRFEIVATGTVTSDGSTIVTDPDSGIRIAGWGCNCPPYSVAGSAQSPSVSIAGPASITVDPNVPFTLTATGSPSPGTYSWTGGTARGPANGSSYTTSLASSGTVTVTYRCSSGATASASVQVTVNSAAMVSITAPTNSPLYVCPGQEVTFTANGTPAMGTFTWTGGTAVSGAATANYVARFPSVGDVTVTVEYRTPGGSSATDTIDLKVEMPAKTIAMTKSRHPLLTNPIDIQSYFTTAAAIVRTDDDGPGDGGADDDVCADLTFAITDASSATFPDQSAATFPARERFDFRLATYNDITNIAARRQLLDASFSNIKLIQQSISASGGCCINGVASSTSPNMIFTASALPTTAIHEWGHSRGIGHRPKTESQKPAIMYYSGVPGRVEINRTERARMTN